MKKIIKIFIPPDKWKMPVIIILGILTGLILFILHVGKADSYLSDNPETCINCHVMYSQYASWQHSSHARVTTCNDCHVPQDNIFSKLFFKTSDGIRHSTIFTLRLEPQVIRIKEAGKEVVQENCERCHEGIMGYHETFSTLMHGGKKEEKANERLCWDCHKDTPHGRVNSLSSAPNARLPEENPIVPKWIKNFLYKK